ncbi:MAG: hypothetical protein P4L90_27285 [Rhodopila sp.]|nr:hypothetical protein [Rhodopila sp.]
MRGEHVAIRIIRLIGDRTVDQAIPLFSQLAKVQRRLAKNGEAEKNQAG